MKKASKTRYNQFIVVSVEQKELSIGAESACKHHWVIESPSGPTSLGVCRNCDQERIFNNTGVESGAALFNKKPAIRRNLLEDALPDNGFGVSLVDSSYDDLVKIALENNDSDPDA